MDSVAISINCDLTVMYDLLDLQIAFFILICIENFSVQMS